MKLMLYAVNDVQRVNGQACINFFGGPIRRRALFLQTKASENHHLKHKKNIKKLPFILIQKFQIVIFNDNIESNVDRTHLVCLPLHFRSFST